MSAIGNSPLEKGDEGGCCLAVRIWSTKYEKGCKLLLYCNFFGLNPDDFTITPYNNRVTGLFML
jgi:hypothetical protein